MAESKGNERIWTRYWLDEVRDAEALDAAVEEAVLDADAKGCVDSDVPAQLAVVFGLDVEGLERRIGVPLSREVAEARLSLIVAAFTECRMHADALPASAKNDAFRHALAV